MSLEWMALVRQLCTPEQERAVAEIAQSMARGGALGSLGSRPPGDVVDLARRFGLSGTEAELWARGVAAKSVRTWPGEAMALVRPEGLFGEIGLEDTVAVVDRLARAMLADQAVLESVSA